MTTKAQTKPKPTPKPTPRGDAVIGMVLVAIAALSWSTAGLFTRVITTDIPTTLFWRSVFGGLAVMHIHMSHQS